MYVNSRTKFHEDICVDGTSYSCKLVKLFSICVSKGLFYLTEKQTGLK